MSHSNLALSRNFLQTVVNERKLELAPHFIAPNSVHHEFGDVPPQFRGGPQAMAGFLSLYLDAFPDLRMTIEDEIATGDRVVIRWRIEGTHKRPLMGIAASGRRISVDGIRIDRIENGKIVESWMQWDYLNMLEQIGALPKLRRQPLHEMVEDTQPARQSYAA